MSIKTDKLIDCSERHIINTSNLVFNDGDHLSVIKDRIAYYKNNYPVISKFKDTNNKTIDKLIQVKDDLNSYVERYETLKWQYTVPYLIERVTNRLDNINKQVKEVNNFLERIKDVENYAKTMVDSSSMKSSSYQYASKPIQIKLPDFKGGFSDKNWVQCKDGISIIFDVGNHVNIITRLAGDGFPSFYNGENSIHRDLNKIKITITSNLSNNELLKFANKYNWQIKWFTI